MRICIISDSRGRFFQQILDQRVAESPHELSSLVLPGRKIFDLWLVARPMLLRQETDFVYLLGGICDISSKFVIDSRIQYWPYDTIPIVMNNLTQALINISDEIRDLNLRGKLAFLPEIGASLLTYNRVLEPKLWMENVQQELDIHLPTLHRSYKVINKNIGTRTNWFLDSIYKRTRSGMMYPRYHLLADGLHPDASISERMVNCILKDANDMNIIPAVGILQFLLSFFVICTCLLLTYRHAMDSSVLAHSAYYYSGCYMATSVLCYWKRVGSSAP